ncbi:MAG TPA: right-handed parallel beta-helix repeat-containing protein [Thermoanaerobaculia bacterium]|nr:right-handed parallel beta-helix repeat-containing protein [Thermoanaerobaculia bacterium]
MRHALLAVFTLAALDTAAQTNLTIMQNVRVANTYYIDRAPAGSNVVFELTPQWFGTVIPENVVVDIDVPGEIVSVTADDESITCGSERPVRCELGARVASFFTARISVSTLQTATGTFTESATIHSDPADSYLGDNHIEWKIEIVDRPVLSIGGILPRVLDPATAASGGAMVENRGSAARPATLRFTLPEGGTFTGARVADGNASCAVEPAEVRCTAEELGFYESFRAEVSFVTADDLDGGEVALRASALDAVAELRSLLRAHLRVTNTNDEGPGSLRQTLLDAAPRCIALPCIVEFHIAAPVPENGRFTIRPATPLPDVRGSVRIAGATDGPAIEIHGSLLDQGHGFVFRNACDVGVSDLTINGFPRHAIEIDQDDPHERCTLWPATTGAVIARNVLTSNERGVVVSSGDRIEITANLISDNRRAGIFIGRGEYASIANNRILRNGASGMFLHLDDSLIGGAGVTDNVVAFNGEWGICRTRATGKIELRRNSIYGNVSQGIDAGLDNVTPNRPHDGGGLPNKPVLLSATYDPVSDTTLIRGRLDSDVDANGLVTTSFTIEVYESASLSVWGYPQGEQVLATKFLQVGHADFEVTVSRDLRGKFITATNTRVNGLPPFSAEQSQVSHAFADTSEFSDAIISK